MPRFRKIAGVGDIPRGTGVTRELDGRRIAVFNVSGEFYAVDDVCPHRGGPLGEGGLDGKIVTCPWHGWEYDVSNGKKVGDPLVQVRVYEVKIEGDDLLIAIS